MKKDVLVSIKSSNELADGEIIEVVTPGNLYIEDGIYKVVYKETEISGMDGTTTKLFIDDINDNFILEREGTTTSKMEFKQGESNVSLYNTPFGMLDLQIHTKLLETFIEEEEIEIGVIYSLSLSGQEPIDTDLKISIKMK